MKNINSHFRETELQYEQIKEWTQQWENTINDLFHINMLRVQYHRESPSFKKEDEHLKKASTTMKQVMETQLAETKLHHQQKKVLIR